MGILFPNQYEGVDIWQHKELPLLESHDYNFYRCIEFKESYYGKTISVLHQGNLRLSRTNNRFSNIFPGQKLSYWADSPQTARAEIKKWKSGNNILTFCSYDDGSSSIPTVFPADYIRIIDGIHCNLQFGKILEKVEKHEPLTNEEQKFLERIAREQPDCLAYKSQARAGGVCFLFFGEGFKKLALREVRLRMGDLPGKNTAKVACAITSDFMPVLKSYGCYFSPIARIKYDEGYEKSDEYKLRKEVEEYSHSKLRR